MISSRSNSLIQKIRKLKTSLPDDGRLVIIEGFRLIEDSVRAGASVEALLVTPQALKVLEQKGVAGLDEPHLVSEAVMKSISLDRTPSGFLALVEVPERGFQPGDGGVVVICGVQDPGNSGALLRVVEGTGCSAWFSETSPRPLHPKVVKASMGASFRVSCGRGPIAPVLDRLKREGRVMVGAKARHGTRYDHFDWKKPFALLLGREGSGIPEDVKVDSWVSIPMEGRLESLNVAVAGGILLYEAFRQRGFST